MSASGASDLGTAPAIGFATFDLPGALEVLPWSGQSILEKLHGGSVERWWKSTSRGASGPMVVASSQRWKAIWMVLVKCALLHVSTDE